MSCMVNSRNKFWQKGKVGVCTNMLYYYTFRIEFDRDKLKFVYVAIYYIFICMDDQQRK